MAKGPRYCVPLRRRREGKTNYKARKALLLSGKPRLVVRGSLKNTSVQMISAKAIGDEVIVSAHTRQLAKRYEWKAPRSNIPAAYLAGLLCGLKAKARGIDEAILDMGLSSPTKGSSVFATLQGVLDAGVVVPHNKEKLPQKERLDGLHIAGLARILADKPEEYRSKFSKYLEKKLDPDDLPKHTEKTKKNITTSLVGGNK